MNTKGMGIGQVFVFIVAAITFALIAIFGYNAVSDFLATGEDVEFTRFKLDIEQSVKQIYSEYGSVRKVKYRVPGSYTQICFVNLDANEGDMGRSPLPDGTPQTFGQELQRKDPLAYDIWETAQNEGGPGKPYDKVDQNVFLTPPAPVPIKVHHIELREYRGTVAEDDQGTDKPFLCQDIRQGSFSLFLEGKGRYTEISNVRAGE
ncbi:TPA: hypothetical protein HA278_06460 [Candidatus Woesearchaeota archaeon]|nr:hypothetical protein [Candidatus Woesearchaeota archaeon]